MKKGSASQSIQPRRLVYNCYLDPVGVKASPKSAGKEARNLGGCTSDALLKNAIDARRGISKPIKRDRRYEKKKEKQKHTKEKSYKGCIQYQDTQSCFSHAMRLNDRLYVSSSTDRCKTSRRKVRQGSADISRQQQNPRGGTVGAISYCGNVAIWADFWCRRDPTDLNCDQEYLTFIGQFVSPWPALHSLCKNPAMARSLPRPNSQSFPPAGGDQRLERE